MTSRENCKINNNNSNNTSLSLIGTLNGYFIRKKFSANSLYLSHPKIGLTILISNRNKINTHQWHSTQYDLGWEGENNCSHHPYPGDEPFKKNI